MTRSKVISIANRHFGIVITKGLSKRKTSAKVYHIQNRHNNYALQYKIYNLSMKITRYCL